MLSILLLCTFTLKSFPVNAQRIPEDFQKELADYLIDPANFHQSDLLSICNEYESSWRFSASRAYTAIKIGADWKNIFRATVTTDIDKGLSKVEKAYTEKYRAIENKLLLEALTNADLNFGDKASKQLSNYVTLADKVSKLPYAEMTAFVGSIKNHLTKEQRQACKDKLNEILQGYMPTIKEAFPSIEESKLSDMLKKVADSNAIDILKSGMSATQFAEKMFYAIALCNSSIEIIDDVLQHLDDSESSLRRQLNDLREELQNGWQLSFWNSYLKDKTIDALIGKVFAAAKDKAPGAGFGVISGTVSWTSFINEAIFSWILKTPAVDDYVISLEMWGFIIELDNLCDTRPLIWKNATYSDIYSLITKKLYAIEINKKALSFAKSLAKYNKRYNETYIDQTLVVLNQTTEKLEEYLEKTVEYSTVFITADKYNIVSSLDTNKALDICAQSLDSEANVHLWSRHSGTSQQFSITNDDNYCVITNINSNKALDVSNGNRKKGANVWQYTPNGTDSQKWRFLDAGDGYYYIQSALGTYLDACNGDTADGTNIWTYSFNGSNAQKWALIPVSNVHNHTWNVAVEAQHPHKQTRECTICGITVDTGITIPSKTCKICYPNSEITNHTHSWNTQYESVHPHKEIRICSSCGQKEYTGSHNYVDNCSDCNPSINQTKSWSSWSGWQTSPVYESSTRQVEQKTQYVYYHYLLTYSSNSAIGTYPINKTDFMIALRGVPDTDISQESYHEYYSDTPLEKIEGSRLVYWVTSASKKIVYDKYPNKCSMDSGDFNGNANLLFYKGTRILYRYRDYQ